MRKRVFAFLLSLVMLLNSVPVQAFATVTDDVSEYCVTEGCVLKAEPHTECNVPEAEPEPEEEPEPETFCENEDCLLKAEAHETCVYCATEGCILAAQVHDACQQAEPQEQEETPETDLEEDCDVEGCVLTEPHETCVFCTTEGCTLAGEAHTDCNVQKETFCDNAQCLLHEAEEHETCVYCATEGCLLAEEAHDACVTSQEEEPQSPVYNLGWEYAAIEFTDGGVATDVPEGNLSDKITVSIDGEPMTEGELAMNLLTQGSEAVLTLKAAEGYALGDVAVAISPDGAFDETVAGVYDAIGFMSDESTATEAVMYLADIYDFMMEGDPSNVYLLVELVDQTEGKKDSGSSNVKALPDWGNPGGNQKTPSLDRKTVYVAVYNGDNFPGEPAWYDGEGYTFFNSSFGTGYGYSTYSSDAADVLSPDILNYLSEPVTTDDVTVWGYYNASGTKDMIIDSALKDPQNEKKIIRTVKGSRVNPDDYRIIWYVIKYQTDTDWHIDGLVVPKGGYAVNYYGNGSTSGGAPDGATGLQEKEAYTVKDNEGGLQKKVGTQSYVFAGWKDEQSGIVYQPGDTLTMPARDVSLHAQWLPPTISISVSKIWNDDNDELGLRPESVKVVLMDNESEAVARAELTLRNNWSYTWEQLPAVTDDEKLITYSIEEIEVSDYYTVSYSGNQTSGYQIVNTIDADLDQIITQPGSVVITGQKIWQDGNNTAGRPDTVTIKLMNGTKVLATAEAKYPNWTYSFDISNIDFDPTGVTLTIDEEPVTGYTKYATVNPHIVFSVAPGGWGSTKPCNSLEWTNDGTTKTIVVAKMTGNNPAVVWTPEPLAPFQRALVEKSIKNSINQINSSFVYISGEGVASDYGMIVGRDSIEFSDTSDWAMFFTGTYTTTAVNETVTSITNVRSDYKITVNKVWNDNNNQDGLRPEQVVVHLLKENGDHTGKTLTLKASEGWTGSWDNLPMNELYDSEGKPIAYTIREETVNSYTARYSGSAVEGFTITNTHQPETTVVNVQKIWNDRNNQDGIRPDSVKVQLYANGQAYGHPIDVTKENNYVATWYDLPKKNGGETIAYTVAEVGTASGYTLEKTEYIQAENLWQITNKHEVEKTDVTVTKIWNDNKNQDGLRPVELYVTLFQNGVATDKTLTLTDRTLSGTFENLDVHHGIAVDNVYTVHETGYKLADGTVVRNTVETIPEGYTASHGGSQKDGYVLTNTHDPAVIDIPVTKVWNDNHNQDGKRPESVTVTLYKGDETLATKELSIANDFTNVFEDLAQYENGTEIQYQLVETAYQMRLNDNEVKTGVPAGYTAEVTGTAVTGFTVTNTHTPETINLKVQKVWDDNNDLHKMRPEKVKITLYANGVAVTQNAKGETISAEAVFDGIGAVEENNIHFWNNMPKYEGGEVIDYTVKETHYHDGTEWVNGSAPLYSVDHQYDVNTHVATVINTYSAKTTSLTIQKIWNDDHDRDGLRPGSVTFEIWWTASEDAAKAPVSGDAWKPVEINSDGDIKTVTMTPGADGSWLGVTVTDLPMYFAGSQVYYGVVEKAVTGYTTTYAPDAATGVVVVTNTHTPASVTMQITKHWEDSNDQDGIRPENSITLQLHADGDTYQDIVLEASNNWTATVEVPYKSNRTPVFYSIEEIAVEGYVLMDGQGENAKAISYVPVTVVENKDENGNVTSYSATVNVYNKHEPEVIDIPVRKIWDDNHDQDGKRPESITATLYKTVGGKTDKVKSKDLTIANEFKAVFEDLPKKSGGQEIVYTVKETAYQMKLNTGSAVTAEAPAGYTSAVTGNKTDGFVITNTHTPEKVSVTVNKTWSGDNNGSTNQHRPREIELHLLKNGVHTEQKKTVREQKGKWTATWENLPKYADGYQIQYTITEKAYENYTPSYSYGVDSGTGNITVSITNTYSVQRRSLTVEKIWDDTWNQDNLRPESIRVQLYRDGQRQDQTLDIKRGDNWIGTFTNLEKGYRNYHQGGYHTYVYTVEEIGYTDANNKYHKGVPAGYTVTYDEDEITGNLEVINHHAPEKTTVSVTKVWNDNDNQDGLRPVELYVTLFQNGVATDKTLTLTDRTLSGTFENLDAHHGIGVDNVYTVHETGYKLADGTVVRNTVETIPEGYTASHGGSQEDGYVLTNTHVPAVIDIPVTKVWNDNHNQDGKRPESVTVTLYKGDENLGTRDLSISNDFSNVFENLPKYENGTEIQYRLAETAYQMRLDDNEVKTGVPADYTAEVTGTAATGFTVTNSHTPETIELKVQKVWDDNNDLHKMRPEKVKITLYANGVAVTKDAGGADISAEAVFDGIGAVEENNIRSWSNMPKYEGGEVIDYTVRETHYHNGTTWVEGSAPRYSVIPAYDVENHTATVTNRYTPETMALNIQKVWVDDHNRDGLRPESVTFAIWWTADSGAVSSGVTTGANSPWKQVEINADKKCLEATMTPVDGVWLDVTVPGLPLYYNGSRVYYGVVEKAVDGYTATYATDAATGVVVVTNTHEIATTSVSAQKVWNDTDNQDGIRPVAVQVTLYADGDATDKTQILNAENQWTCTFGDLPENSNGTEVYYTIHETGYQLTADDELISGIPAGYTAVSAGSQETGYTITNTHAVEKVDVSFVKVWDDANDQDGKRPDSITVNLLADGTKIEEKTVTAEDNFSWTFRNLDKYKNAGTEIVYTLTENDVADYEKRIEQAANAQGDKIANSWVITNTHTPEQVKVTAEKIWNDDNNRDGVRPDEVDVHLFADGVDTNKTKVLKADESGAWQPLVWENLPKYAEGQLIRYTVHEDVNDLQINRGTEDAPQQTDEAETRDSTRYIATYVRASSNEEDDSFNHIIMTNTYFPETIEVNVVKVWDDDNNRDGVRHKEVVINLLEEGSEDVIRSVTLSAENDWMSAFTNLPKYKDKGTEIRYSVEEVKPDKDPYTTEILRDQHTDHQEGNHFEKQNHFSVINRYTPATTGVKVTKHWVDEDDNDGLRPKGILVQLLANATYLEGEGAVIELDAENEWSATFQNVAGKPLYVNQNVGGVISEIKYSVMEVGYVDDDGTWVMGAISGYNPSYDSAQAADGYTVEITNTHAIEKTSISVEKKWDDADNNDGIRPSQVKVTLMSNGSPWKDNRGNTEAATVILSAANNWRHTWEDVKVYQSGKDITYTVVEETVTGYTPVITGSEAAGFVVTNVHVPEVIETQITKVWKDYSAVLRPGSVTVQLYKNGVAYGDSLKITSADKWVRTVVLPVYEKGQKIEWTVKETNVPLGYTVSYNQKTLTITNTVILSGNAESPFTGDNFNLTLWSSTMGVSGAGILALLLLKKKKSVRNK